jgi:bla regulator protein BlaR1
MGVWNPVIFIPDSLVKNLSSAELKAVIAHECAHVARRDDIAICWQQLTSALFFFNPFLRYANRQLAEVREICCDALAVRSCRLEPRAYGQTLLRVIEQLGAGVNPRERMVVSALLTQDLQWRLRCLVAPATKPYRWRPLLVLLGCLLCVSIFLGGTGKPLPPVIEGDAVKTLVDIAYTVPVLNALISSGVHITQPLGCHLPARDHFHAGIDFVPTTSPTASVRAFADGVIESVSQPPGNIGWMVRIDHGRGLQSTYVRLDRVSLPVGTVVNAGEVFASMGARAQTDHLHFELTHQGRILDPAVLFVD